MRGRKQLFSCFYDVAACKCLTTVLPHCSYLFYQQIFLLFMFLHIVSHFLEILCLSLLNALKRIPLLFLFHMGKMFILLIYWDVSFTHLTLNSLVALICMCIVCMAASICPIAHIQTNKLLLTFKCCLGGRQATAHTPHHCGGCPFPYWQSCHGGSWREPLCNLSKALGDNLSLQEVWGCTRPDWGRPTMKRHLSTHNIGSFYVCFFLHFKANCWL